MANGQWSGTLVLAIDPAGTVTGHFRSDRNGSAYPVTGKVAAEVPQKIDFSVQFPRARQSYAGFLWTEGKNAIAGSVSMLDHPYSFIAVREGTSLGTEMDLAALLTLPGQVNRRVVILEPGSDRYTFDGQARSGAELTDALSKAAKKEPATGVLLRVGDAVPFGQVRRAADAIRAAGVTTLRLAPASTGEARTDHFSPSRLGLDRPQSPDTLACSRRWVDWRAFQPRVAPWRGSRPSAFVAVPPARPLRSRRGRDAELSLGDFMPAHRPIRSILPESSNWPHSCAARTRTDGLFARSNRRIVSTSEHAFVGGPLIPGGIVVSVVRSLVSRLGRFFTFERVQKTTERPACGTGP